MRVSSYIQSAKYIYDDCIGKDIRARWNEIADLVWFHCAGGLILYVFVLAPMSCLR